MNTPITYGYWKILNSELEVIKAKYNHSIYEIYHQHCHNNTLHFVTVKFHGKVLTDYTGSTYNASIAEQAIIKHNATLK